MSSVTAASIRAHAARLVASTIAIVIAVGFVVATLTLNETSRATLYEAVGAQYVHTDVVAVDNSGAGLPASATTAVGRLPGVRAVDPFVQTSVQATVPGRTGAQYLQVDSIADDPGLRWQHLSAGRLPQGTGEIAVSERAGASVGDVVPVTAYVGDDGTEVESQATVVGIVDLRGDPSAGLYGRGFVTLDQARAWGAGQPTELRIAATRGTDADALAGTVSRELRGEPQVTVRTGTAQAAHDADQLAGDGLALTTVLLVFATVAVLVAGLVIANTFAVLLAQRTRDLALLRCVGATARQIRRSVLGEAVVTGLVASAAGVAAGIGLAALISAVVGTDSPIPLSGVTVPLYVVLTGLLVGTVTTLLAALAPTRAATRVAPLAALRPLDPAPLRSRGGIVRLVLGILLAGSGGALMALGAYLGGEDGVLSSLAGGVLSFLGVVLLCQRAVPPVVAAAGRLLGRFGGVPARLAAGNAVRNPRRTAATATALLIGVTLTTAMVVGASSTRATAVAGLDAQYPVDVVVSEQSDGLPSALLGQLTAVDGVARGTALTGTTVTGPDDSEVTVQGVDPDAAAQVQRSTSDLPIPTAGTVVLPWWTVDAWHLADGDRVPLTSGDRTVELTARFGDTETPLVVAADLARLAPDAPVTAIWLRLAGSADQTDVVDQVTDLAGTATESAVVTGLASERAALDQVVDVLLLVVTGLLGVAVLIALIGVGNTLALSVVERRQESGLLRALGLTRRQLRGLLAWEAVLVAGVAAVLGVVLGAAYGLIGAVTVLGDLGEMVLSVPWLQVLAIVVVATVAGLLASVLPARRAARTPPVAAIAS